MPYLTTCDRGWDCGAWDDPPTCELARATERPTPTAPTETEDAA